MLDLEGDVHKTVIDAAEMVNPWNIFLELLPPDSGLTSLPAFEKVCWIKFTFIIFPRYHRWGKLIFTWT